MSVTQFRPFKIPKESTAPSFNPIKKEDLTEFMEADLKASGLVPEDLHSYVHTMSIPDKAQGAYVIPYFNVDLNPITSEAGDLLMFRRKIKWPPYSKKNKYDQPTADQLHAYDLPSFLPYLPPLLREMEINDHLAICEGEKKTASVIKHLNVPALGIGGMQMWRHPDGSGGVHPWIVEFLQKHSIKTIEIIPDGDLWKYDICKSYGDFASALRRLEYEVAILNPPDKIDDLIVDWADNKDTEFEKLERLDPSDLVESRSSLARDYDLATEYVSKNKPNEVQQHNASIMTLLERHPAFPTVWRNLDTSQVYIGDTPMMPDVTEMELTSHFQYSFQFNKIKNTQIRDCVRAIAGQNAESPMLEWVKAQVWDGTPRIEEWLIKYWEAEDSEWTRQIGLKFLVSAVARMMDPGCKVDWMFVTVGGQGIGKTSLAKVLFRNNDILIIGRYDSKDFKMLLHSGLCMVVDELDSFGKAETSFWKATISATQDTYRPPYTASNVTQSRRCVLYGTANRHEFLTIDPSGYRRYAPVEVHSMLHFKELENDLGQLWAEAYTLYQTGSVDYGNIIGGAEIAEQFVAPSMYDELVSEFLDGLSEKHIDYELPGTLGHVDALNGYVKFRMSRVLEFIGMEKQINNTALTKEVAAVLRGHGCERGRYRLHGHKNPMKAWRYRLL